MYKEETKLTFVVGKLCYHKSKHSIETFSSLKFTSYQEDETCYIKLMLGEHTESQILIVLFGLPFIIEDTVTIEVVESYVQLVTEV